jgi:hypothetical protein
MLTIIEHGLAWEDLMRMLNCMIGGLLPEETSFGDFAAFYLLVIFIM